MGDKINQILDDLEKSILKNQESVKRIISDGCPPLWQSTHMVTVDNIKNKFYKLRKDLYKKTKKEKDQ